MKTMNKQNKGGLSVPKTLLALLFVLALIALPVSCARLQSMLESSYEALPTVEPSAGTSAPAEQVSSPQSVSEPASEPVSEVTPAAESREEVSLTFASKKLL